MAKSLRSRSISAGRDIGFFGQLNENTARRKTQAENLERMNKEADLHREKSRYASELVTKQAEKEKAAQQAPYMVNGVLSQRGHVVEVEREFASSSQAFKNAVVAERVANASSAPAATPITPRAQKEIETVAADVKVAKASVVDPVSTASQEPFLFSEGAAEVDKTFTFTDPVTGVQTEKLISGTGVQIGTVDLGKTPDAPEDVDKVLAASKITVEKGGKKFMVFQRESGTDPVEVPLGNLTDDVDIQSVESVHPLDKEGKPISGVTRKAALINGIPMVHVDDKWVLRGDDYGTADKRTSFATPTPQDLYVLTGKEQAKRASRQTTIGLIDTYLEAATIGDQGVDRAVRILSNTMGEWLTANNLGKGDPSTTMAELIAMNEEAGVSEDDKKLINDNRAALLGLGTNNEINSSLAYNRGILEAARSLLPVMLAVNFSESGRPNAALIQSFRDGMGESPGDISAGRVGQFKKTLQNQESNVFEGKYTADNTPRALASRGWVFTGQIQRDPATGKHVYGIKRGKGPTISIPVTTLPSVADLNQHEEFLIRQREGGADE